MPNYSLNQSDILYMLPGDIKKLLPKSDFALIIAIEPATLETVTILETLLMNFERAEEYEYCAIIKKEIDYRINHYKEIDG